MGVGFPHGLMAGIIMIIQAFKGGGWGVGIMGVLALLVSLFIWKKVIL